MVLGIDIGGTNVKFGIVDSNYKIIKKYSIKTLKADDISIINDIISKAKNIYEEFKFDRIGIGSPGKIDSKNGICVTAGNLPYNNTPIVKIFEDELNVPVSIENDGTCAVLGELNAGAGKIYDNFVIVTLGTGIGGGIVIDRKLYTGLTNLAGEFGHMTIKYDGPECVCGNRGCFEMYASVTALIRQTESAVNKYPDSILAKMCNGQITGKSAFEAAQAGCPVGEMIVDRYIEYLSYGINNIIRNFEPQAVIIGGAISNEGDNLLTPLKEKLLSLGETKIEVSHLGNDAGIIGAAGCVMWKESVIS